MTVARSLLLLLLLYESWQEGEVMMIWLRQNEAWHLKGEYWFLITFSSNKEKKKNTHQNRSNAFGGV